MKTWFNFPLGVLFLLLSTATPTLAADSWHQFSAQEAQASQLGKEKLNPDIRLYMMGEQHTKVLKELGSYKSNKRTNSIGKSDQIACDTAFLSALIALQDRAVKEGGNAVADIYSITKNKKVESAEQYSCVKGAFVTNVALMGTVVKLGAQ